MPGKHKNRRITSTAASWRRRGQRLTQVESAQILTLFQKAGWSRKAIARELQIAQSTVNACVTRDEKSKKQYLADSPPTIVPLAIKPHFDALTTAEKLYAHHISLAAYAGTRIVLRQVSPESEDIYDFILALYHHCNGDWKKLLQDHSKDDVSENDLQNFLDYAAQFLGNVGNYKSFGDSKFLPRIEVAKLSKLASGSELAARLFRKAKAGVYDTEPISSMHLGYPDEGHMSAYYPNSPGITKEDISLVSSSMEEKKLLPENTRLRKKATGNFDVLISSKEQDPVVKERDAKDTEWDLQGGLAGKKAVLVYGDHQKEMSKITENVSNAAENALNEVQKEMHQNYAKSFRTGSLEAFKQSQRCWIRDKGPLVECNIGFIETYRDPHGIRGEWEGFVAMVNKERTKAFGKLVNAAPELIPKLPWGKDFEKDEFLSPDFTSLEVLSFAGSGIPAGINIPNYDDIRQTEGFKNVSLGNVLSAKRPGEPIPFIKETDLDLYSKYRDEAFEVQVGLHELLGHGCGKLLQETSPGKYNFDIKNPPTNPLTGKPVDSWYRPGQTWGSVFGGLAPTYEECRAECVAMLLTCDFGILRIFGFGSGEEDIDGVAGDLLYASYLSMARAGVAALEFWDPKSRKWGQAHMQARFSILRTFLDAGSEFASLNHTGADASDLTITIDRNKILSHGRAAVQKYLQELHIHKATANFEAAKSLYDNITNVDKCFEKTIRPAVLAKKVPRKVFVQANTIYDGEKVKLKEYAPTAEGMIQSYADRAYI